MSTGDLGEQEAGEMGPSKKGQERTKCQHDIVPLGVGLGVWVGWVGVEQQLNRATSWLRA